MTKVMKKFLLKASIAGVATAGILGGAIAAYTIKFKPESFRNVGKDLRNIHVGFDGYSIDSYLKMDEEAYKEIYIEQDGVTSKYIVGNTNVDGIYVEYMPLNLSIGLKNQVGSTAKVYIKRTKLDGSVDKTAFEIKAQLPTATGYVDGTKITKAVPSYQFLRKISFGSLSKVLPQNDYTKKDVNFSSASDGGVAFGFKNMARGSRLLSVDGKANYELDVFGWYTNSDGHIISDSFGNPVTMIPKGSFSSSAKNYQETNREKYLKKGYDGEAPQDGNPAIELVANNQLELSNTKIGGSTEPIDHAISDWNNKHKDVTEHVVQNRSILKFKTYEDAEEFKRTYVNIKFEGFITLENQIQKVSLFQAQYSDGWNLIGDMMQSASDLSKWKEMIYGAEINHVKKPILKRDDYLTTFEKDVTVNTWW